MPHLSELVTIGAEEGHIVLSSPYHPDLVALFRSLPDRQYHPTTRQWSTPLTTLHISATLQKFPAAILSDSFRRAMMHEAAEKDALEQDAPQPDDIALPLYPYQCQDVLWLRQRDNAILGSEPGTGKTVEGIAWASAHLPCLVVCPAAVKLNWQAEILRARPQDSIEVLSGYRPYELSGAQWTIINYQILNGRTDRGLATWIEALVGKFSSLIGDEAHIIRNFRKARMARAFVTLALPSPRCLLITGTPVVNNPTDLYPLLVCTKKRPHTYPAYLSFLNQYHPKGRQPRNLAILKEEISPYLLRRRKGDVLKELPPKRYKNISLSLDPTHQKLYVMAREDILKGWAQELKDPIPLARRRFAHLGHILRMCHLSSMGKIDTLEELLHTHTEERRKVVVFSCFLGPLDRIYNRFQHQALLLTGAMNATQKFEAVKRFQEDDRILFALCSLKAMGLGITLSAADIGYLLDLPWTPMEKIQAEDRLHRLSQPNAVEIIHLLAKGTIDEHMLSVLEKKAGTVEGVMGEGSSQWAVLRELENILARESPNPQVQAALNLQRLIPEN